MPTDAQPSPKHWAGYLVGHAGSVRAIAGLSGAWKFALGLVLLAAVARNYDQLWIGEAPLRWIAGNTLFSLGSGTFVFLWIRLFLANGMARPKPGLAASWLRFMGLFWATAPMAWLYAIPVERLADSLAAARFNVALLAVVSLWRVLLIARATSVLHAVPFVAALAWVVSAACLEVTAVYIFGPGLARDIMAGMGGLRNSPEENLLLGALHRAANAAILAFVPAVLVGIAARRWHKSPVAAGVVPAPAPLPWKTFAALAAFWIAVAIPAQREVRLNAELDALVAAGRWREALDHLAAHGPKAYAPSRQLPPKAFEYSVFTQLPNLLGALATNDPPWLHAHLLRRWNILASHLGYVPATDGPHPAVDDEYVGWRGYMACRELGPDVLIRALDGLECSASGRAWVSNNVAMFAFAAEHAAPGSRQIDGTNAPPSGSAADMRRLDERLARHPKPRTSGLPRTGASGDGRSR